MKNKYMITAASTLVLMLGLFASLYLFFQSTQDYIELAEVIEIDQGSSGKNYVLFKIDSGYYMMPLTYIRSSDWRIQNDGFAYVDLKYSHLIAQSEATKEQALDIFKERLLHEK